MHTFPEQGFIEKKNSSVENHTILSNIGLGGSETVNKKIFHWENFKKTTFLIFHSSMSIKFGFQKKILL